MRGREPVKLKPVRKNYIWGTEDWMLSKLHKGLEEVPLLIKIITAREALSVQVHPEDALAWKLERTRGKTEMWYVIDCEPGAHLYYGLKHRISVNEFQKRIRSQTFPEVCRKAAVKKGDVFFIPAGQIHAIGKGITVAEVQQSSDITYRIYDYNREDGNHQRRELHVDKALLAANFMPPLNGCHPMGPRVQKNGYSGTLLVQCPHFVVQLYEIEKYMEENVKREFCSLLILEGEGSLRSAYGSIELSRGDSIFLPKETGAFRVTGRLQILLSEV